MKNKKINGQVKQVKQQFLELYVGSENLSRSVHGQVGCIDRNVFLLVQDRWVVDRYKRMELVWPQ